MSSESAWSKKLKQLPKTSLKHSFFRMVRAEDRESILSTGPSFIYGGRYNKAGEFGALYLSESPGLCQKEKLRQAGSQADLLPPQVLGEIEIEINAVLDLMDLNNIKRLGIRKQDLTDLMDLTIPQSIAEAARLLGFRALLVPSAVASGKNLVIFEESISKSRCKLKVLRIQNHVWK